MIDSAGVPRVKFLCLSRRNLEWLLLLDCCFLELRISIFVVVVFFVFVVFFAFSRIIFITTVIPMISALEAAIRAAVAIMVFKDSGISPAALALSSLLIWMVNIILPSIAGYFFLVRQNFNFKLFRNKNA
jgi:hypothetical protein